MTTMAAAADEHTNLAAYEAISETLSQYIMGAREGNGDRMRRAFMDGASIRGSYGGQPVDWTLQDFCEAVDRSGAAPDLKARVVAVELAASAAMARLEAENWGGTRYTDFFVLIRRDNGWRISSKVFFAHARA